MSEVRFDIDRDLCISGDSEGLHLDRHVRHAVDMITRSLELFGCEHLICGLRSNRHVSQSSFSWQSLSFCLILATCHSEVSSQARRVVIGGAVQQQVHMCSTVTEAAVWSVDQVSWPSVSMVERIALQYCTFYCKVCASGRRQTVKNGRQRTA